MSKDQHDQNKLWALHYCIMSVLLRDGSKSFWNTTKLCVIMRGSWQERKEQNKTRGDKAGLQFEFPWLWWYCHAHLFMEHLSTCWDVIEQTELKRTFVSFATLAAYISLLSVQLATEQSNCWKVRFLFVPKMFGWGLMSGLCAGKSSSRWTHKSINQ